MKNTKLTPALFVGLILLILGILYLEVLWLDWLIQSILHNDINRWLLALILMGIGLLTPRKLAGLPIFIMFLTTCYVWIS